MQVNPYIFREYDIRGTAEKDLSSEIARPLGRAIGTYLRRRGVRSAAVGRDCRLSSPRLAADVTAGLLATGVDVVDVGLVPTPVLYFALHHLEVGGGVMITGSHNPPEMNGLKVALGRGTIYGEEIQALRALCEREDFEAGRGARREADVLVPYLDLLSARLCLDRPLKVAVDCGNGMAGLTAPALLRRLGCQVEELYTELDGRYPNHHPDPTVEATLEDLKRAVREGRADCGLGFDGDADRLGVVDETGRVIWGDQLLILFARDLLSRHPGAPVIFEVKCSQALVEEITRCGGVPLMSRTGHSLIKKRMQETGALLAGEMSGHLFFADEYFGYDDALYAAGRLLRILAAGGRPISAHLADVPRYYATPEIRLDCPDERKFQVVGALAGHFKQRYEVIDVDGARVLFPEGWGLVRASNTQPVLVLRFEARTPEGLAAIRARMAEALRTIGRCEVPEEVWAGIASGS